MQIQVKKWGNGSGIRFTKEFLREAGITMEDTLNAEIVNGQIILTPVFRHRSLRESCRLSHPERCSARSASSACEG